jgi:hypothetical protein
MPVAIWVRLLAVFAEKFLLVQYRAFHLFDVAQAPWPIAPTDTKDTAHDLRDPLN